MCPDSSKALVLTYYGLTYIKSIVASQLTNVPRCTHSAQGRTSNVTLLRSSSDVAYVSTNVKHKAYFNTFMYNKFMHPAQT